MTITSLTTPARLDDAALGLLFDDAHTTNAFTREPVDVDVVRRAYEHLRWAPTAMNTQPLRLTVLGTPESREPLVAHLSPGNQAKTLAAPLTVVAAYDPDFHEHMPVLAPFRAGMREQLAPDAELRDGLARTNGLIQLGYLILALRAEGLQVGPMAGMDAAGVDGALHAENGWRVLAVLNVGHAADPEDERAQFPRAGRLEFDQVAVVR
ncbi:malonic semialdehyde reductase [Georgenia sp. SYP-B2076]|uniref:malonic semialdehyde reductase n=1 Tax=Georgenia sp. SYP-B2076 TaxID=2495881 RepID=UPI000F8E5E23|nr:malonic semialdehyde reductase [Georgenia sp. SYP-B2076]